jgi:hypothetical protein
VAITVVAPERRRWRTFELQLASAGFSLDRPMLNIGPLDPSALQYRVPAPPRVVCEAGGAEWIEWVDGDEPRVLSPAPGNCLSAFLRLDRAASDQLLAFATAWGPLHDSGFEELGLGDKGDDQLHGWRFTERIGTRVREPLDGWRNRACQLAAILRGAASLQRGEPISAQDRTNMLYGGYLGSDGSRRIGGVFDNLYKQGSQRALLPHTASIDEQGRTLAMLAAEWIPPSDLALRPEWDPDRRAATIGMRFTAQLRPLVTVLGIELAAALSSPTGLWSCDGCGYPYTPERVPRRDRRRFCLTCSTSGAAARAWWHEHRSKQLRGAKDG